MIDAKDYPNRTIGSRMLAPSDAIDRQTVSVNLTESPLAWLARRGLLSARQVAAGERLRGDHARAGLGARVTMRWDAAPSGSGERYGSGAQGQALWRPSRRSGGSIGRSAQWGRAFRISCGAWLARGRVFPKQRRGWGGRHGRRSWC